MFNTVSLGKYSKFHIVPEKWTSGIGVIYKMGTESVLYTSQRSSLAIQSWKLLATSMPQDTQWTIKEADNQVAASMCSRTRLVNMLYELVNSQHAGFQDPVSQHAKPTDSMNIPWFWMPIWFFWMHFLPLHVKETCFTTACIDLEDSTGEGSEVEKVSKRTNQNYRSKPRAEASQLIV